MYSPPMTLEKLDVARDYVLQAQELNQEEVTLAIDFVLDLIATARKAVEG